MTEQQWNYAISWMTDITALLEEIAINTRSEKIEEPKRQVKGFKAGGTE